MNSKLQSDGCYYYTQQWRRLVKCYEVKAGVVCLQLKLCDPHVSALEVRFDEALYKSTFSLPLLGQLFCLGQVMSKCTGV